MKFFNFNLTLHNFCTKPPEKAPLWEFLDQIGFWLMAIVTSILWCSIIIFVCALPIFIRYLYIQKEKREERETNDYMEKVFIMPSLDGNESEVLTEEYIIEKKKYTYLVDALPNICDNFEYISDMEFFVTSQLRAMQDRNIEPRE